MSAPAALPRPPRWQILLAYGAIYFVWGSTFLAMAWAVETIPPFPMIALRCLIGGVCLGAIALASGAGRPSAAALAAALGVGVIFFLGNHALLATAQQRVPTGVTALIMATIPMFIPLGAWLLGGRAPTKRVMLGIGAGMAGVALLVHGRGGPMTASPWDAALLLFAAFAWGFGTALSARLPGMPSPVLAAALQLLGGAAAVGLVAPLLGQGIDMQAWTWRSIGGFAYLTLFGTVVTFGAFVWLLRVEPPWRVGTYAFVNPVLAVLLGWLVLGEQLTPQVLGAMALIVVAVVTIVRARR
jgi:drug/metabolite transporter (DMT)-like permease